MPDGNIIPSLSSESKGGEPELLVHTCEDLPARLAALKFSSSLVSSVDVYWTAEYLAENPLDPSSLPTPDILTAAGDQLSASFVERAQCSAFNGPDDTFHEQPLALYCPVEGGNHIIDNTVRELARRFTADVVVLDLVHLAAGQWGRYGQMGALLNFEENPLRGKDSQDMMPQRASDIPHSPCLFFDALIDIGSTAANMDKAERRPRIIYIRDLPFFVDSLSHWWPQLQSAVRFRQCSSLQPDTLNDNQTVIVIGATSLQALPSAQSDDQGDASVGGIFHFPSEGTAESDEDSDIFGLFRYSRRSSRNSEDTISTRKITLLQDAPPSDCEEEAQVARQREINTLAMAMAVGSLGASLSQPYRPAEDENDKMWTEWGQRRISWSTMYIIARRAVGSSALLAMNGTGQRKSTGDTHSWTLSWDDIRSRWDQHYAMSGTVTKRAQAAEKERDKKEKESANETDKEGDVVDQVKHAKNLSRHEKDLLTCIVDATDMPTSFNDVHLPAHTIDTFRTFTSLPLLHPEIFQQGALKQHGIKGSLLFGPPGVGKTHLVRALAKECGARMLCIQPSHILQKYVGEDEKCVRAVFSLARRLSPCIVFIDEIDTMFPERSSAPQYLRSTVTEYLQEMDGLSSKKDGVIVVGATNRPFDLDDAVLRRLPLRILVELPNETDREAILKIHLQDEELADNVDLKKLAHETDRFSGSDLKHLVISAALDAAKETVDLPWRPSVAKQLTEDETAAITVELQQDSSEKSSPSNAEILEKPSTHKRILHLRNFAQALTEIWPSASEHLQTHQQLKEWNDKFGSGGKQGEKVELEKPLTDHESTLAKVRRAFDLTEDERALLKCVIDPAEITTTFKDVHLPSRTVDTMRTIVSLPLIYPDEFAHGIFKEHGMRGSLLFGPPGTGKTHIVRALARESGAHMLSIRPSDIYDSRLGESEKRITALFALARRLSPCIIFIDEIDALFPQRATEGDSPSRAYRAVLTEFMQDMDGLRSKGENVIVVGATNRPFDLDDALLRRLPARLLIDLPNEREREKILEILLRTETLSEDVDLGKIAKDAAKFSGSDLKHLVVGAALEAIKENASLPWESSSSTGNPVPHASIVEVASGEPSQNQAAPAVAQGRAIVANSDSKSRPRRMLYARHFSRALQDAQPSAGDHIGASSKIHEWARKLGIATGEQGRAPFNPAMGGRWNSNGRSAATANGYATASDRYGSSAESWQDTSFAGGYNPTFSGMNGGGMTGGGVNTGGWNAASTLGQGNVYANGQAQEHGSNASGASNTTTIPGMNTESLDDVLRGVRESVRQYGTGQNAGPQA